jgi:hypothetical protein
MRTPFLVGTLYKETNRACTICEYYNLSPSMLPSPNAASLRHTALPFAIPSVTVATRLL